MNSPIVVRSGESALSRSFIGGHRSHRGVVDIIRHDTGDGGRVRAGEVVIVVRLPVSRWTVRISWQVVDRSIFLHEHGVRAAAVAILRPRAIHLAHFPEELRLAGEGSRRQDKEYDKGFGWHE